MAPRLSLFGVIHVDRPAKVADELRLYVADADADAVFEEWPGEPPDPGTVASVAVRFPLLLVGSFLFGLVYAPVYLLTTRAYVSAERVAVERLALPTHDVDVHPLVAMEELGPAWVAVSWLGLLGLVAYDPRGTAVAVAAIGVGGLVLGAATRRSRGFPTALVGTALAGGLVALYWATDLAQQFVPLAAILVFVLAVGRTMDARNDHMLDCIETISAEEGYDRVVLVTGKGHLPGLVEAARERDLPVERAHVSRWLRTGVVDAAPGTAESRSSDPAGLGRRFAAGLVDAVVLVPFVMLAVTLTPEWVGPFASLALWFVVVPVAYFTVFEAAFGWTIGKQFLGLRVTDSHGNPADVDSIFVRNVLRPVDVLVAFLAMVTDVRRRRLGDRIGDTEVRTL